MPDLRMQTTLVMMQHPPQVRSSRWRPWHAPIAGRETAARSVKSKYELPANAHLATSVLHTILVAFFLKPKHAEACAGHTRDGCRRYATSTRTKRIRQREHCFVEALLTQRCATTSISISTWIPFARRGNGMVRSTTAVFKCNSAVLQSNSLHTRHKYLRIVHVSVCV
jgi:hypothetical protein